MQIAIREVVLSVSFLPRPRLDEALTQAYKLEHSPIPTRPLLALQPVNGPSESARYSPQHPPTAPADAARGIRLRRDSNSNVDDFDGSFATFAQ